MNEVLKAIRERRSIRNYTSEPVSEEQLAAIIEAGTYAASGHGRQPWKVIAVTDKALRDRLSEMNAAVMGAAGKDPFYGAPAVLVVLARRDEPNHVYDGSLMMGNMMLAAHALGLGSCWINRARQEFDSEEGKAILAQLGIEGDWEGIGHCIVGHPACDNPQPAPRREDVVCWVR